MAAPLTRAWGRAPGRGTAFGGLVGAVIVAASVTGCWDQGGPTGPAAPRFQGMALELGALDDAAILPGVTAQRGEWAASRGGELNVRSAPVSIEQAGEVDVLVFRADRLGALLDEDRLAAIPNEMVLPPRDSDEDADQGPEETESGAEDKAAGERRGNDAEAFHYMDVAPAFRDHVTRYGNERWALPLGTSALVLVYRRDALEREANRKAAEEQKLKLGPPETWNELDALARFFQGRDWNGDGQPDHGIAVVLGDDEEGLGNATYLARAASLGHHPDQFSFLFDSSSMAPRIATPPFVEALRSLVELKKSAPPGVESFDGAAARQAFRAGKVAMLIDWAEHAAEWSHGAPLGVAPLPGSERVFEPDSKHWVTPPGGNAPTHLPHGGGWLVGARRGLEKNKLAAALDLVRYLAAPESSNRIRGERSLPMLPFRIQQMGRGMSDPTSAPDVDARLWADAVRRTLLAERVVPGLRIPGAGDYLTDLARGRAEALGGKDPETVLKNVAAAWERLTQKLGRKRQIWHYRRGLNLRATAPKPPERGT